MIKGPSKRKNTKKKVNTRQPKRSLKGKDKNNEKRLCCLKTEKEDQKAKATRRGKKRNEA